MNGQLGSPTLTSSPPGCAARHTAVPELARDTGRKGLTVWSSCYEKSIVRFVSWSKMGPSHTPEPSESFSIEKARQDHAVAKTTRPDTAPPLFNSTLQQRSDMMESVVKITLAGFGGSLVGYAKQEQQKGQSPSGGVLSSPQHRRGRPTTMQHQPVAGLLPRQLALSCMVFTLILETCRHTSPTTSLLRLLDNSSDNNSLSHRSPIQERAIKTVGDYTIGGMLAGAVGVLSLRSRTTRFRQLALFGIGAGLGVGLAAGILQAGVDVSNMYLENAEQNKKRTEQKRP